MCESIASCQLVIPKARSAWVVASDDRRLCQPIVLAIDRRSIPWYLYGALAIDIGIHPRLSGDIYLVELELGILADPHDDRGMNAIDNNLGILSSAYNKFVGIASLKENRYL